MQYVDLRQNTTPEIYIGYDTARAPLGNPEGFKPDQTVSYSIPSTTNFKPDIVYLQGNWKNNPDNMELQNDTGRIVLTYYAKSVNIIAGGKGGGVVFNDEGVGETQLQQQHRTNHWERIYHLMVVSELTDKGCII